ncbi:hypothetical protein HK099_002647 [Clydaea vesicula]|uniref:Uncharacterized protein n=1 Tax=Clydaea vesicula TaxID=447962 RepID=A0AAD5U7G1_9FUNG|nr:hypothetical protein HK099_002647 [Clydaea vesicula]
MLLHTRLWYWFKSVLVGPPSPMSFNGNPTNKKETRKKCWEGPLKKKDSTQAATIKVEIS